MRQRVLLLLLLAWTAGFNVTAQDQRVYSQFFMNPYVINPGYVGSTGYSTLFVVHRQQWIGLEDAPALSHASYHTPINKTISFGGLVFNDNIGPINHSAFKATGGYLMKVDKRQYVRFGMSIGGGFTSYNVGETTDPTLLSLSSTSHIMADAGAVYYFDNISFGLAIPNLIGHRTISTDGFDLQLKPHENLTINAGYRHLVNKSLAIEPHLLYRFSTVNMPQYEAAVMAHLGHVVWAGLGYRQDYGGSALFGVKVKETWAVGLAYEYGQNEFDGNTSGSIELSFGINLGKKKKDQKNNAISFIQNFDKTKVELDRAEERRQQVIAQRNQRKEDPPVKPKPIPSPTPIPAKESKIPEGMVASSDPGVIAEKLDKSIPIQQRMNEGKMELGATYLQLKTDSSLISKVKWHDALTETPDGDIDLPDNTVRMKQGKHSLLELPAGHHVIAGEFSTLEEAEAYSDKIFNMGYHGANPAHAEGLEGEKKWVVVVHKGATMAQAEEEQIKWSQRHQLAHVYILNVVD